MDAITRDSEVKFDSIVHAVLAIRSAFHLSGLTPI